MHVEAHLVPQPRFLLLFEPLFLFILPPQVLKHRLVNTHVSVSRLQPLLLGSCGLLVQLLLVSELPQLELGCLFLPLSFVDLVLVS